MKYEKYYQKFLNTNPYPRTLKSLEMKQGFSSLHVQFNNKNLINFSSSDYLGLTNHPLLVERAHELTKQYGVGSSASRLVTGNFAYYNQLEEKLAQILNKPAALILGTGYQTNQSVLEALLDTAILPDEPLVFCDKLAHASILAGVKSIKRLHRFRHNDLNHLRDLLEKHTHSSQPKFILAESIYSMEGDQVNLKELCQIAEQHNAFLYVDDAHAVGIYGEQGFGMTNAYAEKISMVMGTFSKALGSFGGYVGCSQVMKNYLINKCRGLIYSTGVSPAMLGAMSAAIELLPTLNTSRARLANLVKKVRIFFQEENLNCGNSTTHIIPWIIGDAKKTAEISQLLEEKGILATAIQPPSVPVGKSRIRFCLSAAHSDEDIQQLLHAIKLVLAKISV